MKFEGTGIQTNGNSSPIPHWLMLSWIGWFTMLTNWFWKENLWEKKANRIDTVIIFWDVIKTCVASLRLLFAIAWNHCSAWSGMTVRLPVESLFGITGIRGSWLNMAEIELNVLIGQCLNRRIADIEIVRREASAWQEFRNNKGAKVNWQFRSEDARIKLTRLYPTLFDWHDTIG